MVYNLIAEKYGKKKKVSICDKETENVLGKKLKKITGIR